MYVGAFNDAGARARPRKSNTSTKMKILSFLACAVDSRVAGGFPRLRSPRGWLLRNLYEVVRTAWIRIGIIVM